MDLRKTIIRQFAPIVREYIPNLEAAIKLKLDAIKLNQDEEFASYNLVNMNDKLMIILCTYNKDNKVIREIEHLEATELILSILNNKI